MKSRAQFRPGLAVAVVLALALESDVLGRAEPRPEAVEPVEDLLWIRMDQGGELSPAGTDIRDLLIAPSGTLWVATNRGVSRLSEGRFQHFTRKNGLPDDEVYRLAKTASSVIVATRRGVAWIEDDPEPSVRFKQLSPTAAPTAVVTRDGMGRETVRFPSRQNGGSQIEEVPVNRRGLPDETLRLWPDPVDFQIRRMLLGDRAIYYEKPNRTWECLRDDEPVGCPIAGFAPLSTFTLGAGDEPTLVLTSEGVFDSRKGYSEPLLGPGLTALGRARDPQMVWVAGKDHLLLLDPDRPGEDRRYRVPLEIVPNAVAEDNAGRVWLASSKDLFMADRNRVTILKWPGETLEKLSVRQISRATEEGSQKLGPPEASSSSPATAGFTSSGKFWLARSNRLFVEDDDTPISTGAAGRVTGADIDDSGSERRVVVSSSDGVYKLEDGEWPSLGKVARYRFLRESLVSLELQGRVVETLWKIPEAREALAGELTLDELKSLEKDGRLVATLDEVGLDRIGSQAIESICGAHLELLELRDDLLETLRTFPELRRLLKPEGARAEGLEFRDELLDWIDARLGRAELLEQLNSPSEKLLAHGAGLLATEPGLGSVNLLVRSLAGAIPDKTFAFAPERDRVRLALRANGETLVLTATGELLRVDPELSLRPFVSDLGQALKSPRLMLVSASNPLEVVLFDPFHLWRTSSANRWQPMPQEVSNPSRSKARILGLKPTRTGALIGCHGCGKHSLYWAPNGGEPRPIDVEADAVGMVDNAVVVDDTSGHVYFGALESTWRGRLDAESGVVDLAELPDLSGRFRRSYSILQTSQGDVFFAINQRFPVSSTLWVRRASGEFSNVLEIPEEVWCLAEYGGAVWIGGRSLLSSFDGHRRRDQLAGLGVDGIELSVHDLAHDGDGLLVLTDQGLFRIPQPGRQATKIDLDPWPEDIDPLGTNLLRHSSERILVAAGFEDEEVFRSRLWSAPTGFHAFEFLQDRESISVMVESASGDVLAGGRDGQVFRLRGKRLEPLWDIFAGSLAGPLQGALATPEGNVVVMDNRRRVYELDDKGKRLRKLSLRPWKQSLELARGRLLLLHDDGLSALELASSTIQDIEFQPGERSRPERTHWLASAVRPGESDPGTIYLLADRGIWRFDPTRQSFAFFDELKAGLTSAPEDMILAADRSNVWIGTRDHGIWRRSTLVEDGDWQAWGVLEGLPSNEVDALQPLDDLRLLVFTSAGHCLLRMSDGEWELETSPQEGIDGSEITAATILEFADETPAPERGTGPLALAIATDHGVSLVNWPRSGGSSPEAAASAERWSRIGKAEGLIDEQVAALAWDGESLLVGTGDGLSVFELTINKDGFIEADHRSNLTRMQGLPSDAVRAVRVDPESGYVWVLTRRAAANRALPEAGAAPGARGDIYFISRWSPDGRVVSTDAVDLANLSEVQLGPARGGRPPSILLESTEGVWSTWEPRDHIRARLRLDPWLFFNRASVAIESLDPVYEELDEWEPLYDISHIDEDSTKSAFFRPWNIFPFARDGDVEARRVVVKLTSKRDVNLHYYATTTVEPLAKTLRWTRFVLLLAIFVGTVAFTGWWIRRWRIRAARVRERHNPYVVGPPISEPRLLVGREHLIDRLRDSIINNHSQALVGHWRIGKTSIQKVLARELEDKSYKNHKFIAIYIDLQLIGKAADDRFFSLLGEKLVERAEAMEVDNGTIDGLRYAKKESKLYKAIDFQRDLQTLIRHWTAKSFPKKPVVVLQIDETSYLQTYNVDTLLGFRAIFMAETQVRTILSGRTLPENQMGDDLSGWRNFLEGEPIEVEPLTPQQAKELIIEPVKGLFYFDADVIERVIARSEGKPMEIQKTCYDILRVKYDAPVLDRRIAAEDLNDALRLRRGEDKSPRGEVVPIEVESLA